MGGFVMASDQLVRHIANIIADTLTDLDPAYRVDYQPFEGLNLWVFLEFVLRFLGGPALAAGSQALDGGLSLNWVTLCY